MFPSSDLAQKWLASFDVTAAGAAVAAASAADGVDVEAALLAHGLKYAPALARIEKEFGGVAGRSTIDERELWIGLAASVRLAQGIKGGGDAWFVRDVWGKKRVRVGAYLPIVWFAAEDGEVVEVDDKGRSYFASSSMGKRIEQLACDDQCARVTRGNNVRVDGAHGVRCAQELGLNELAAPTDDWQRWWADEKRSIFVVEVRAPVDYGAGGENLVMHTWVHARSKKILARFVAPSRTIVDEPTTKPPPPPPPPAKRVKASRAGRK